MERRRLATLMILVMVLAGAALWLDSHPVTAEQGTGTPDATPAASQAAGQGVFFPVIVGPGATGAATPMPTATNIPTVTPIATNGPSAYTIAGFVQKGPFVQGTEITVRELDNSLVPTGRTFTGSIDDNTGHFSVRGTLAYPYVELAANGFYFNEVSGSLSAAPITLLALADLRDSTTINVNLLTHLERARVLALVDSGMVFSAAKAQAQHAVLAMFNLADAVIGRSETLNIARAGDGNAILLAVSAILQSNQSEAQLTELLSTLSSDLGTDGVLNSAAARQALVDGMEYVKPRRGAIRTNIINRYAALGVGASVPPFEAYAFALDTVAPIVVSTSPSDGADLEVGSVMIDFNELMDHSTLTSSTVQVRNGNGDAVAGSLDMTDIDTATSVVFTPQSDLVPGTYHLSAGFGVQDLAENGLVAVDVVFMHTPISELAVNNSGVTRLGSLTTLTATVPGNNSAVAYVWDFGDGTSAAGPIANHTYASIGTYVATGTASHSGSQVMDSTTVTVIDRAITGLQAANSGVTRLASATTFTATILDGSNVVYIWSFGDGVMGNGPRGSHTYAAVGSYTATVMAKNSVSQVVSSRVVTVEDRAIIGLKVVSTESYPDSPTELTATLLDGSNALFFWSFGDGSLGSGYLVTHTYASEGTYTAVITVTNGVSSQSISATITVLPRFNVLVVGYPRGPFVGAEQYDPATGMWKGSGEMGNSRQGHTATLLPSGKVLVIGGASADSGASAELYDPTTGVWRNTNGPHTARYYHTATLLPNGKVLISGGYGIIETLASAEIYDPTTETWSDTDSLGAALAGHTATLLTNGKVLAVGTFRAELYDPATGAWSATGSPNIYPRTATLLPNSKVLIIDGLKSELYDPNTGSWSPTGGPGTMRYGHTATLLPSGKVLVVGGRENQYGIERYLSSGELFDPTTGEWGDTASMGTTRYEHTATLLPNGKVLVSGGYTVDLNQVFLASAEIYDPETDMWSNTGSMGIARSGHTATLLDFWSRSNEQR